MADNENIVKGLATIGIKIKIGSVALNYPTSMGEIGADANELDTTTFNDSVSTSTPGVQKQNAWTVDYLYDNTSESSDYRKLQALADAGNAVAVEVEFPDGTKFANSGKLTNKINGAKVNELITAVASISLSSKWTVTNPPAKDQTDESQNG